MIGRIEYTSCEDGVDGIRGFQVRAITPGIAPALKAAALRDSVYEPPPGAPPTPDETDLRRFPVALGYTYTDEGVTIYRSSYVGRDHTGRWGNYFAQALTADLGDPLPSLPVDLWESPVWRSGSTRVGSLDRVESDELVAGQATSPTRTADFLATNGRHRILAGLLALLRPALDGQPVRLVLTTDDSASAAQWVAAVTRSLPASLAWRISFTTFTRRPESHSALLTFATPDVTVPTYGNYRALDLRRSDAVADVPLGEFERVVAELWPAEEAMRLVQSAPMDPPPQPDELDGFVRCALLFDTFPVAVEWQEPALLDGLEFGLRRSPASLAQPWDGVAAAARDMGEIRDVPRWGHLLRGALDLGARVPGPLLQLYVRAAVEGVATGSVSGAVWVPSLDDATRRDLAEQVLVPALLGPPAPSLLDWLDQPAQAGVRETTADLLAARAASPAGLEDLVTTLPPEAAAAMGRLAGHRPRLWLASATAVARSGVADPVEVLVRVPASALTGHEEWALLVTLLWPDQPPTAAQAAALLAQLPTEVLRATGLVEDHIIQRLLEDCSTGLTVDDHRLAKSLRRLAERDRSLLSNSHRQVVDLITLIGYFEGSPPYPEALEPAQHGVRLSQSVIRPELGDQFAVALARWLLQLEWREHRNALRNVLLPSDGSTQPAFTAYARRAEQELATAKPAEAALMITAWRRLTNFPAPDTDGDCPDAADDARREQAPALADELLELVLARGLARSNRRHLERIGDSLVAVEARSGKEDFQQWWTGWQQRHERPRILDRFRGRGRG